MFDQPSIEKLKHEFTDKYVVVDAALPELARFTGLTGQIKTVNMSGRALVQFEGRNNTGWFDIGLDFLKLVPKPEPKPDEEKPAKKPAPAAKQEPAAKPEPAAVAPVPAATPASAPTAVPAAEKSAETKPAAPAKKMSTADILAALKKKA